MHVRTEWTLTALAKEQVRQVLEQLQVPTAETLTVRLHDATGGNPFFLLETIQELREAGRLTASPESSQELPLAASVRETVQHRLERLQPVARQVLEAGAVWGPTFTFEIVRQTAGRSELETVDGLDELVGRHLLREDAQGFCFHHELARSAVYRTLSQLRRRVLHRRAAQTLEGELSTANESQRARVVAQLGFHYAEAGEAVCAVAYLLKAGDYARNLYEHEVAVAQYQQALRLLRTQDDPAATARVLMKLGLTYHTALDYGQARAAFEEGFSLYQRAARTRLTTPMPAAPHPLRVGNALPSPATCDPAYASDISSVSLCQQLFSGLVTLNSEFDIIPDVAQRWEVLGGGRTYVFHLRQDVYWTDGTAVTAHDFDYAWKRVLKPETKSPSASLLYDIQGAAAYHQGVASDPNQVGIQALDARTLAVTLAEPVGYFLALLAHAVCLPVPRHVVERAGEQWTAGGQPVTNGPFRLVQWAQDEAVRLTRYVNYHGVFPGNVHEVILLASTDWSTHLQRYRAGELDVLSIHYPPTPAMNQARQQFAGDYASLPSLYTDFVTFDVTRPPFQDTRVRQALALALDKEVLADVILQGYVFPATGGFLPPTMPGHAPQTVLAYNPRRAQQLLAEAGYPGGQGFPPVEWLVPQWLDILTFAPIASYMQAQWREHLGINFTYQLTDWPIFVERVTTTPPQILMATWDADYPDPDNFLRKGPAQLYARWQDEVFDWLVEDARNSLDQAERMGIYQQLDRMVVEEAVIIPLTYSRMHLLIQPWLQAYPTSSISWWFWKDVVIAPH